MVRELGFEMKAQPSSRMRTEEELAREEQERLRHLEVLAGLGCRPGKHFIGGLFMACGTVSVCLLR